MKQGSFTIYPKQYIMSFRKKCYLSLVKALVFQLISLYSYLECKEMYFLNESVHTIYFDFIYKPFTL